MREKLTSEVGLVAATGSIAAAGPTELRRASLRVLLVEDDAALARAISAAALGRHDVTSAEHGAAALKLVDEVRPAFDLVVSDIHMPWMNGVDLHRALVARGSVLASRFVLMSGAFPSTAHQAYLDQAGVVLLMKPFPAEELDRAITRLLLQPVPGPARAMV